MLLDEYLSVRLLYHACVYVCAVDLCTHLPALMWVCVWVCMHVQMYLHRKLHELKYSAAEQDGKSDEVEAT